MRVLVDKLPTNPKECLFNIGGRKGKEYLDVCNLDHHACECGNKDFECPYLKEFKAIAKEGIPGHTRFYKSIPVELE